MISTFVPRKHSLALKIKVQPLCSCCKQRKSKNVSFLSRFFLQIITEHCARSEGVVNALSPQTFFDLVRHVHACQVGEHQHPGLQAVGVAERRLLLLDVDVSQLPDEL